MAKIVDGRFIASEFKKKVALEVLKLKKSGVKICLAVVVVGSNVASEIYINNKARACESLQIDLKRFSLNESVSQIELNELIKKLNYDKKINGVLVQLPLPCHLNEKEVVHLINPVKDVDGFCCENIGRLFLGYDFLKPCTAAGIVYLLDNENVELKGKRCVIIGRSNIVGKPLALMLMNRSATVTVCCSETVNLEEITKRADVLISATGQAKLIKGFMVKEGAVVVDVGINRDEFGKICGDVNFSEVVGKASALTPVPGGVGPMTVAMLMNNVVMAAKIQNGLI